MGQGYLCAARHSHVHAAQSLRFQHGVRCGAHRRGRNTHRGRGGRPAGRPVRPDMLCAGRCEKYIRHGLLYADEHRGHTCGEQKRPAHHRGRRPEREGDLCAGGQCVRGRGGHPMAAGRAEAHQRERRQRVFRKQSEGQRGRVCGARVHRAGRAVLGYVRPGRHPGADAGRRAQPYHPRGAGGHRLPDAGCAESHAGGQRRAVQRTEGGRRRFGK